uniref:RING-type domain-containing protein n=1 Tax=Chaetoceros debilis TaxID=122233 RepID=A0A7S3V732_9STRA
MNCQVCQIPFECNPSSQHIPCVGSCGHVVCRSCISPKCPRCHKDSFSPNAPIINHGMVEFMLARDLDSINNSIKIESGEGKDSTEDDNFERIGSEEEKIDCSDVMTIDSFRDDDMNELNSLAAGMEKLSDVEFIHTGEEMDSDEGDKHKKIDSQERKIERRFRFTIEDSNDDPCSDDLSSDNPCSDDPRDDSSYNCSDDSSDDELDDRIETVKVVRQMARSSSIRGASNRNIHTKQQIKRDNASTNLYEADRQYAHVEEESRSVKLNKVTKDILTIDDSSDDELDKMLEPFAAKVSRHQMARSSSNRGASDENTPKKQQVKRDNASTNLYEGYAHVEEESRSYQRDEYKKDTKDILTIDDSSYEEMREPFAAKVDEVARSRSHRGVADEASCHMKNAKRDIALITPDVADEQHEYFQESRSYQKDRHEKGAKHILTIDDSSDDEAMEPLRPDGGNQTSRSRSNKGVGDNNARTKQHKKQVIVSPAPEVTGGQQGRLEKVRSYVKDEHEEINSRENMIDINDRLTMDSSNEEIDEIMGPLTARVDDQMSHRNSCSAITIAETQNRSYRLPTPAPHWYGEYSPTRSVYRVSQHSKDAESDKIAGGKYGERPAEWSVENGWITIMARSVPNDVKSNEIKKYLCKTEVDVIKKACEKELFWEKMKKKISVIKRYINTDRKFVQMSAGDIIALRVPGPAKKGIHFFGIVESDDLHVWTHEQLLDQGWPCNHILTGSPWWRDRRVMLRKVKWYRWGYTRELPGSEKVCRWLCENMPLWLIENPKGALNVLSGFEFINCTNSVDDL